jgi:hypothetical protein
MKEPRLSGSTVSRALPPSNPAVAISNIQNFREDFQAFMELDRCWA